MRQRLATCVLLISMTVGFMLFAGGCKLGAGLLATTPKAGDDSEQRNEEDELRVSKTPTKGVPNPGSEGDDSEEDSFTEEDFLKKMHSLQKLVDAYFLEDVDKEAMYEGMLYGLLNSLDDPYTCYYSAEDYKLLEEDLTGVYCGIGAMVSQNASTKVITIVRPFVDGPAFTAGILPDDILVEIDGEDISSWDIDLAVKKMKGVEGTDVQLRIWRPSEMKYIDMTVTRAFIEVETVTYEMLDDSIGYIYVMQFDQITTKQFELALNDLKNQGMKGLIVDVRDNPGGALITVCDMLDFFLDDELFIYSVDKYGERDEIKGKRGKIVDVPMVVLQNDNSASASEIFSGALQDYGKATIVGVHSYGKGIMQSLFPFADGSAVKMTVSSFYTPKGRTIHEIGIPADIEVELDEELRTKPVITKEEDNQLQRAIEEAKRLIGQQ